MIVRLKENNDPPERTRAVRRFQFYDSPIKRTRQGVCLLVRRVFQFYDSPIKSRARETDTRRRRGFNSMIVRLKVKHSPPSTAAANVSIL